MLKCDTYTERKPAIQIGDLTLFVEHTKQRFYEEGQQPGEPQIVMRSVSGMLKVRSLDCYATLNGSMFADETFDISAFAPMLTGQCKCTQLIKTNTTAMGNGILAHADLQIIGELKFL